MYVWSSMCVVVFYYFFCLPPCEPSCSDIILMKIKHCSLCVDAEEDQPCLSVAFPSVSPCCLTSFPLLLYLIRDPVLQCGNEACVRRAAPPGIRAPHTSEKQRGACISILYCFLEPSCLGVLVLSLHCISVRCSLMCCHEKRQVRCCCVCLCVCALTYILVACFEFICALQHKKKCSLEFHNHF